MNYLKKTIKGQTGHLVIGALGVLFSVAISFVTPLVTGFVIDFVLGGDSTALPAFLKPYFEGLPTEELVAKLWIPAALLLGLSLFNCVFIYLRGKYVNLAAENIAKTIKDDVYAHLMELPYDYHKHVQTGDVVQRCTSDIDMLRRFIGASVLELVRACILILSSFAVVFSISPKMAFISAALVPVIFVVSLKFFTKIKDVFEKMDAAEADMSTMMQENFSGMRVVRAFGQQKSEIDRFAALNRRRERMNNDFSKTDSLFWALTDTLCGIQIEVSFLFSVIFCLRGEFSVGTVVLIKSYCNMMIWPARQLGRLVSDLSKSVISGSRIREILDETPEKETGRCLTPDFTGRVEFRDICFSYEDGVRVLDGVSFTAEAGQTVGILGTTGSGKSSLVQLIQRLYRPDSGVITIDGTDINDIERHHLRRSIGLVLQEPFLYSRTIMENLKIVCPDASDEEVYEATRIACIHDDIESFEKGYDTMVGERGMTLSGGQKQRIAIARMLMQKAPIIVFDDSLSAVDTETDARIREALGGVRAGTTSFIISHRITTLCEADKIIVIDRGKVVEQGTHEELMASGGLYRRIADMQHFGESVEEEVLA